MNIDVSEDVLKTPVLLSTTKLLILVEISPLFVISILKNLLLPLVLMEWLISISRIEDQTVIVTFITAINAEIIEHTRVAIAILSPPFIRR